MNFQQYFILIFLFPICFSSDDLHWYNTCGNTFSCGYFTQVWYPFWGGPLRPKECGHPDLELSCENNINTIIQIRGVKYQVLELDPINQILRITRQDFLHGICLQKFTSTSLNELLKYGSETQNLTVFYGCQPLSDAVVSGQFTCKINGTNATVGYSELGIHGLSGCYASVMVPVLESSAGKIDTWSLSQVIGLGFQVEYKVEGEEFCDECEDSFGRCGFDVTKNRTSCFCPDGSVRFTPCSYSSTSATPGHEHNSNINDDNFFIPGHKHILTKSKIIILASFSGTGIGICMLIVLILSFKRRNSLKKRQYVEAFLKKHGSPGPKRYTYKDLKKITNSFKVKLGEGGYGVVYQGKLHNEKLVAVKILKKKSKGDTDMEEFINEVASIGETNHKNIVKLQGFCYEGQKRALLYDYMPNGSLEKFTYGVGQKNDQPLSWEKLFEIAVGIARGLEYLHQGCNTRILHFDIKPQNILLDENFCPKISDFGLAKSCLQKDSLISMSEPRGTVGYIAPEVFFKSYGGVSHKSDVYSYGMLVLEMVGCRNNADAKVERSSEQYFPHWIYKQLKEVEELNHEEITNGEEGSLLKRNMILVSLWCIQTNPLSRPNMTKVVEMLEGSLASVPIPPMPSLASPWRSQQNSSTMATILIGNLFQE